MQIKLKTGKPRPGFRIAAGLQTYNGAHITIKDLLNESSRKQALRIRAECKARTAAIAGAIARMSNAADSLNPQMHAPRWLVQSFLKAI